MKDIKKILAEIETDYKPEYGIVLSILPYATYYNQSSVIIELRKRVNFFEKDEDKINQLVINAINELDDIYIKKMGEKYGENDDLKYTCASYNLNRRILEDSCRGICLVNSLRSHEYLNMNSKEFGTMAKNILKLINSTFLNNEKYDNNNFEDIVNTEQENLVFYKQNKYKKKVVNYIPLIKKWKENAEINEKTNNNSASNIQEIKKNELDDKTNDQQIKKEEDLIDSIKEMFPEKVSTIEIDLNKSIRQKEVNEIILSEAEIKLKLKLIGEMIAYNTIAEKKKYHKASLDELHYNLKTRFEKNISNLNSQLLTLTGKNNGQKIFEKSYKEKFESVNDIIYGRDDFKLPDKFDIEDFIRKVTKGILMTKKEDNQITKNELMEILKISNELININYPNAKIPDNKTIHKIKNEEYEIFKNNIKNNKENLLKDLKGFKVKYNNVVDVYERIINNLKPIVDVIVKVYKKIRP